MEIYLVNGKKTSVACLSTDTTDEVRARACLPACRALSHTATVHAHASHMHLHFFLLCSLHVHVCLCLLRSIAWLPRACPTIASLTHTHTHTQVLEETCRQIGLQEDLTYYFALYMIEVCNAILHVLVSLSCMCLYSFLCGLSCMCLFLCITFFGCLRCFLACTPRVDCIT